MPAALWDGDRSNLGIGWGTESPPQGVGPVGGMLLLEVEERVLELWTLQSLGSWSSSKVALDPDNDEVLSC